jgi:plastocyanin
MMKRLALAALLALPQAAFAADKVIIQKGRAFNPKEVSIDRGDTLTFTNEDEFIHQMYAGDLFDSDEKRPGQKLTETFSRTGTFEVRCHIHPKMKLVVRVN